MKALRRFAGFLGGSFMTLSVFGIEPAQTKDLAELSKLLTPAYTAMSYAGLCSTDRDWAISQPQGHRGLAIHYAQHVKDEIVELLSYGEALRVLKAAADAAREDARAQVRQHVVVADKAREEAKFREWCDGYVVGFIQELISKHDGDHGSFIERVTVATTGNKQ